MGDRHQEVVKFFGAIPWLQQLSEADIVKVARAVSPKRFGAGEVIVHKGTTGDGYYYVWKGQAVVASTIDSAECVLGNGHYFGTIGFDSEDILETTVAARDEVICLVLYHTDIALLFPDYLWKQGLTVERMLRLENLEEDCWQGNNLEGAPCGVLFGPKGQPPRKVMFGGQFVGQALAAAVKSVEPSLSVHSLHSYFLYVGDFSFSYKVEKIRDSPAFATRNVTAIQRGRKVFTLLASFQRQEESITYQDPMPHTPDPTRLRSHERTTLSQLGDPRIPMKMRENLALYPMKVHPLDVRQCEPNNHISPRNLEPSQNLWLRCKERLPDDQALHRCVVAYASDWMFVQTVLRPYEGDRRAKYRLLSLDHSMWFHKDIKADEWLLFQITSPRASGSRGLVIGHMYNQSGELVVTAVQQGLVRPQNLSSKL
ncbi:uncharacterized protein LOC9644428 isoform X2 [Selaginella moellendorffii]|uniref:uncharacterized protein LOC9644428 isoform X2 n=1 Tax=Selaginella moellendorffii TaxID=88036 RepID=UPI000D1C5495|nr:uncharacterized protein LOC9644428 isoform X2 [Selaginella moellendorffii]|eukprot:XP_024545192.1 uncharacterized protein LOC9644428 isoform X2 [Selaginella moellendorffii]